MTTYLRIKYADHVNPREFWFEGEIDDMATHASECYTYFTPNPKLTIQRLTGIIYDLSLAGIQSELITRN